MTLDTLKVAYPGVRTKLLAAFLRAWKQKAGASSRVEQYRKRIESETGKPFPQNDNVDTLTMAIFNSWSEEKRRGLTSAVRSAIDAGTPLSEKVTFDDKTYVLGYALGFIKQ